MAKQPEEKINRRLGRVEMLLNDLGQVPEGYQPTEFEVEQIRKLVEKILHVYGLLPPHQGETAPVPEPPAPEPKTENRKPKTEK